ncbi:MAG: hypothetical protein ACTSRO_09985 [Candidatus Heimdallarchaeaceae archaeon]
MRITKNERAKLDLYVEFGFDSPATVIVSNDVLMESGKKFYEKLAENGLKYLLETFEKKGWKVEKFEILSLNYFFRPYGETQSKISIYEVRFTIEIIPTPEAITIEFDIGKMKTVKLEDIAETAGISGIISLSILLGMFIFGWLTSNNCKYMVEKAVTSPYGESFFKTVNMALGFGIAAIVAVVVIYIMGLLKGD